MGPRSGDRGRISVGLSAPPPGIPRERRKLAADLRAGHPPRHGRVPSRSSVFRGGRSSNQLFRWTSTFHADKLSPAVSTALRGGHAGNHLSSRLMLLQWGLTRPTSQRISAAPRSGRWKPVPRRQNAPGERANHGL